MTRHILRIEPVPEEDLKGAVEEFLACALKALEGQLPSQRQLAALLNWPETTLSTALKQRSSCASFRSRATSGRS